MHSILSGSDIGNDCDGSSFYHLLSVQINLTEKGFLEIDHVTEATCCYMRLLVQAFSQKNANSNLAKDADRYLNEIQQIRDIEANYSMVMEAENTVTHLAQMLQILSRDKSHLVYRAYQTYSNMDKQLYCELLQKYIHPGNMNLTIRSKKLKPNPEDGWVKDRWFAVDHKFETECFDLLPESQDNELPINLNETTDRQAMKPYGQLWYCQKTKYKDPRAYIELLYRRVIEALLLEPEIVLKNEEKANPKVLQLNDEKFAEYLSSIRQDNYNNSLKPNKLLLELNLHITRGFFESQEKREAMDNLTLNDLLDFRKQFLASTFIQFLVVGNFDKKQSISCFDYAIELLKSAKPIGRFMMRPVRMPKPGFNRLKVRNLDASSRNTYSKLDININGKVLQQLNEKWLEQRKIGNSSALAQSVSPIFYAQTMNLLLRSLLSEPCFNYLRTIKSLGYSVYTSGFHVYEEPIKESSTRCQIGMQVASSSQTNHHELNYVSGLVLAFWTRAMPCIIDCISNEDFEVAVEGLIEELRVPKVSLNDLFTDYRDAIVSGEMLFNSDHLAAYILEKISRCEFTEFVKKAYLDSDQPPSLLLLECDGLKGDEETIIGEEDNSSVLIKYKFVELTEKDNDEMLSVENDADIEKSHECVDKAEAKKRRNRGLVLIPTKTTRPKLWNDHNKLRKAIVDYLD
ncbi:hypothetical protein Ciccas_004944 [Cichlidogyrus casuarinus]|uniref:Peptidase M16 C-terminal domain-containing protein n=1 Tax=Cichlidogyrus casuarinus TaxID=1844966 RepID=A0ABD2QA24_9PLAT